MTDDKGSNKESYGAAADEGNAAVLAPELAVEKPVDVPPDGGYGWVCVACTFFINACCWGINSSYGVYLSYYLSTNPPLFKEATPLMYAMVGGLTLAFAMLSSPVGTFLTRNYGSRVTLLIGCVLQAISLIGASFATRIWHLFLSQGVLFGFGMGLLFVASVAILPQWFSKRRSVANGISAAGSGIGGISFSLGTNAMLKKFGLAWTFRTTAIIAFVVNTTCSLLLRDRNKQINPNQKSFDTKLLRRKEFLLITGWGFFSMLGYIVILYSLPSYGVSVGLTKTQGSIMGAMLNLGMALGRPLIGYYSDSVGRLNIAGVMTFISGLTVLVIWINATTFGVLIFFAIVNGAVCGVFWTTIAPVCAEVVGLVDLPSALNLTWLSIILPMTFAEAIGLGLRTGSSTGNGNNPTEFRHAQIYAGMMYMGATLCMYLLRVWKVGDMDRIAQKDGVLEPNLTGRRSKWFRWVKV